jgi:hypothetical protein
MRVKGGSMNVVVEGIDILNERRAAYGRQILPTLSAKLVPQLDNDLNTCAEPGRYKKIKRVKDNDV